MRLICEGEVIKYVDKNIDSDGILNDDISCILEKISTAYDVDKVIERLQTELSLADKEKKRCAKENPLQFDTVKGYAYGMAVALEIVNSSGVADDGLDGSK